MELAWGWACFFQGLLLSGFTRGDNFLTSLWRRHYFRGVVTIASLWLAFSQIFYSNAGWSKKWNDLINKGTEYGSVKSAWLNITTEADQLAEIHSELQIRLSNQVHGNVQRWKSANYHKAMLSWKETKNAEEGFSKAQKPWAKRQDEGIFCIHLFLIYF